MKCPHCEYESAWDVKGEKGDFYTLTNDVKMERATDMWEDGDINHLCGCPSCKKTFID